MLISLRTINVFQIIKFILVASRIIPKNHFELFRKICWTETKFVRCYQLPEHFLMVKNVLFPGCIIPFVDILKRFEIAKAS